MDWLLFLHIVAGALWVGGVMWQEGQVAGARREGEEAEVRAFLSAQATNGKLFPIATIVLIGTAVWMILARGDLGWGTLWIDFATALFVLSFINGIVYFDRGSKQLRAQLEEGGYTEAIGAKTRTMHMVGRAEIIVLLALVWLMVFQPG